MGYDFTTNANSLEEFWMPFTPEGMFKKKPRMVARSEGMYYYDTEGKQILDGIAGLWCTNAGHNRPKIAEAIKTQLDTLDYASNFIYGHPTAFKAASRLIAAMPEPFTHVFFSNSGSEAVDTALKMAMNYHRLRGEGTRQWLIGRNRSYHGVNFGGISVCGLPYDRVQFGQLLPKVDHIPDTHDLEHNRFTRGEPEYGAHFADSLEEKILFHDPANVAAVIVEPISGATGVLPPPKGYLQKLRQICDKYGVLLIFDEVITGFGRMGDITSSRHFGVTPDIITMAKGLTNGVVPMGATFVTQKIHETFMPEKDEDCGFMHGYTYSGHPLAVAAAIGTLDTVQDEKIWDNAKKMSKPFEDAIHSLKDKPHVVDIRNCGILGCIQLEAHSQDDPGKYAREASYELFNRGMMIRYSGSQLFWCPPLILDENHIDQMATVTGEVLNFVAG